MKTYAGIGSRNTPPEICSEFTAIAYSLHFKDYILRSGGADGADSAFEAGLGDYYSCHADHDAYKEIWLPWRNFNDNKSQYILEDPIPEEVEKIAKSIYTRWDSSSYAIKRLHARNVYQILGHNLKTPVEFVVCWTDRPIEDTGGTMFGIHLAISKGIPVYNFYNAIERRLFIHTIIK